MMMMGVALWFRGGVGMGGGYPLVGLGRWAGKAVHRVLTPQGLDFVNSMQSAGPAVHHCAELHSALLEFLYLMRFALY